MVAALKEKIKLVPRDELQWAGDGSFGYHGRSRTAVYCFTLPSLFLSLHYPTESVRSRIAPNSFILPLERSITQ